MSGPTGRSSPRATWSTGCSIWSARSWRAAPTSSTRPSLSQLPDTATSWSRSSDVIKSSYRVKDWQASGDDDRLAVAEAWANVLRFELEHGAPRLVVILGEKTAKPLKHLVRKRLIAELPETVTIYHYSYIGSRPQGRLGPMRPGRVAAWGREFMAIAGRANALAAE